MSLFHGLIVAAVIACVGGAFLVTLGVFAIWLAGA